LGDFYKLDAEALAFESTPDFGDDSQIMATLHELCGPALATECKFLEEARVGEVRLTKGYQLPAKFLIHSLGPFYKPQYKTASESGLHQCYLRTLECVKENNLSTVAIHPLYSRDKSYPRHEAPLIALRTIRRFLDKFGSGIDAVVLVVDHKADEEMYRDNLPLYFPRNAEEADRSRRTIGETNVSSMGDAVVPERSITIGLNPTDDVYRKDPQDDSNPFQRLDDGPAPQPAAAAAPVAASPASDEWQQRLLR